MIVTRSVANVVDDALMHRHNLVGTMTVCCFAVKVVASPAGACVAVYCYYIVTSVLMLVTRRRRHIVVFTAFTFVLAVARLSSA